MPEEGILTQADMNSIRITHFIFHVIIADDDQPDYLDEIELTDNQKSFFRERFKDASAGIQYLFIDPQTSRVALDCAELFKNINKRFIGISKQLATDFLTHHKGNVNDGVFIFSVVTVEGGYPLIFMIKMDHKRVLSYTKRKKGNIQQAIMTEIEKSFVEDKSAMQKVAIVDVGKKYAWDVIAKDRALKERIPDYFQKFLGVREREVASTLTRRCITLVRQWAQENFEELPEDVSHYKSRAHQYMETHDTFDSDSFIDMVVRDDNPERKERLVAKLKDRLSIEGILGNTFKPKPDSLGDKDKINIRETEEGVKIQWKGIPAASNLTIPNKKDDDGSYHILIKTSNLKVIQ